MANNPETYECRTALKNCFSALSDCRRVAMRVLPVNFFVEMFTDMVNAILDSCNPYSDIVTQAIRYRKTNGGVDPQFIDATMDIFDNTLNRFNINDPRVSRVYREFLTNTGYITYYINCVVENLNPGK